MRNIAGARVAWVRSCTAAVLFCGLFGAQSVAADAGASSSDVAAGSKPLASAAEAHRIAETPKIVWPDNGIAQRRLDGGFNYNMFVENDNGTWRAWVQSDMSDYLKKDLSTAKALDFFSGQELMVKASVEEYSMQQEPGFWDPAEGKVHSPRDRPFMFTRGRGLPGIDQGRLLELEAERCSHAMVSLRRERHENEVHQPFWAKIPLIYDKTASKGSLCEEGGYSSRIRTMLDLNDGTFLVTIDCWIFRLSKSDLSPVGEAPALRIVNEANMKAAIDQARGQRIESGTAYLARVLNLHIDESYACGP